MERFRYLFNQYVNKTASIAERLEFQELLQAQEYDNELKSLIDAHFLGFVASAHEPLLGTGNEMLSAILSADLPEVASAKLHRVKLWPRIAVAASVVFALTVGGYFYFTNSTSKIQQTSIYANDVAPGRSSATLTLADGRRIVLADALKGKVAEQAGVDISKTSDGQVVYQGKSIYGDGVGSQNINVLTTAEGEKYQVVLPDGSKVWLNAASSLKFPATFARAAQRKVELSGEAYFEIAKDKHHPFVVLSPKKQEIEVLGTHFNINGYDDEPAIRTTLVEGSVKVTSAGGEQRLLKPDQQASVLKGVIKVEPANTEEILAWKNDYFRFNDEKIENIMRQLSRWYAIEVVYEGNIPVEGFNGKVSRSKNISQVLKGLESTKLVHFKIEGRRVTVMGE